MTACAHCGRMLGRFEAAIGNVQVCHPDDPNLPDCYHLVTVYHEELGSRSVHKAAKQPKKGTTS